MATLLPVDGARGAEREPRGSGHPSCDDAQQLMSGESYGAACPKFEMMLGKQSTIDDDCDAPDASRPAWLDAASPAPPSGAPPLPRAPRTALSTNITPAGAGLSVLQEPSP